MLNRRSVGSRGGPSFLWPLAGAILLIASATAGYLIGTGEAATEADAQKETAKAKTKAFDLAFGPSARKGAVEAGTYP